MNKQKFLAELQRLLVFMTEDDRAEAVRRCAKAFDAAGPEGEADLIDSLGSPTKAAIAFSRGYEPGKLPDILPRQFAKQQVEPAPAEEDLFPAEPAITWTDLPDFEPAESAEEAAPPSEDEKAPDAPAEKLLPAEPPAPAEKPMPMPYVSEEDDEDEEPVTVIERSMSLGLGIPLFILVFGALGIPLGILAAAVSLLLLAPGCAVLFGAYLVFVGGLWCTSYMADAVLLFGLTFVVLAAGLLILWLGIWLAVKLLKIYGKGVGWIAGELLGRKVTADHA